jgi:para-aminobenzoate synthetase component 1
VSTPRVTPLPRIPRDADGRVDVDAIVDRLDPLPLQLLETVPGSPHAGRWSYIALIDGSLVDAGTGSVLTLSDDPEPLGRDPFAAIDTVCSRYGWIPDADRDGQLPPFTGGLVGSLSYDLARRVERLPAHARADREVADVDLRVCGRVIAIDHELEQCLLIEQPALIAGDRDDDVTARLGRAVPGRRPSVGPGGPVRTSLARDAYARAVESVLAHLAAGDAFQVNLTQRLTATWDGDVHQLYRALRAASPAPFGAVVQRRDGGGIASISPETFLHVDGRAVRTRPIKGTRPRAPDPGHDRTLADELTGSQKDRAENVMVVDMERNDLGRVCVPGSVRVPRLLEVEAHPTVWHLVSTVEGELRPDVGFGDLLRATFPCGSVTGTPKVRAMSIIDRLEPVRRGVYCGAIGFLSAGTMSTSVAIRTASLTATGTVDYGAGGGVVADSDPLAEHAESLDKAAAFLRAIGATGLTPATP